jgi:hypothetical protein
MQRGQCSSFAFSQQIFARGQRVRPWTQSRGSIASSVLTLLLIRTGKQM